MSLQGPQAARFQVIYAQLTFFVYLIGAVVGGRLVSPQQGDDSDVLDGELATRAFNIMMCIDQRMQALGPNACDSRMEEALLYFFQTFRKVYISDTASQSGVRLLLLLSMNGLRYSDLYVSGLLVHCRYG